MKKKAKKHDPRSEAAQRAACKKLKNGRAHIELWSDEAVGMYEIAISNTYLDKVLAIFDLRDCYRKRKPLTGIMKKVRKAVQPKRGRGKKRRSL